MIDSKAILQEVRENRARLEACPRHTFVPHGETRVLARRFRCIACQGEVDHSAKFWYERGLAHATSDRDIGGSQP